MENKKDNFKHKEVVNNHLKLEDLIIDKNKIENYEIDEKPNNDYNYKAIKKNQLF